MKATFYVSGIVTALVVTATAFALSGALAEIAEEIGPMAFTFLWILLPFAVLPSIGVVSRKTLLALVVATVLFWTAFLVVAARFKGGMNFGMAFIGFLSPLIIGSAVLAVQRFSFGSRTR